MDIILNTIFNNPALPIVPMPGFRDDFERPNASTLGKTLDGKDWELFSGSSNTAVWGTFGDGTAGMKSSGAQYHIAAAEALTGDGVLTATLASVGIDARGPGLAFRVLDKDNWFRFAPYSDADPTLWLHKRVGGTTTVVRSTSATLTPGDNVTVRLSGTSIKIEVNGTQVLDETVPDLVGATKHGMYAFSGAVGAWHGIEFTA